MDEEEWDIRRKSKDKIINSRDKDLIDLVGEIRMYGTTRRDEKKDIHDQEIVQ